MKQNNDKLEKLYNITEQISESYIAEAMPRSLKDAHLKEDIAAAEAETTKEEITMTGRITRYITTGLAAAAAIGMVVGGTLLIGHLNRKDPVTPGGEGSSTIETEPATTAATSATSDSMTTTETAVSLTGISDFVQITTNADGTPITGYAKNLMGYSGYYYEIKDGQLRLMDTDPTNPLISDGVHSYKTVDNGLYCNEDGKLIGKIENPEQYIDCPDGMKTVFYYTSVTPVSSWWYFVTAQVETYPQNDSKNENLNDSVQLYFWFNSMNELSERVTLPVPGDQNDAGLELFTQFVQVMPNRDAVFAYSKNGKYLFSFPLPGASENKCVPVSLAIGQFTNSIATPLTGSKVLCTNGIEDEKTGFYHIRLEEIDMETGNSRVLFEDTPVYEIYNLNGKVYCICNNTEGGSELQIYQPDSNTFRTILKPELEKGQLSSFTAFWNDGAVINGYTGCEETFAIHVTSLEKGTYEFLQ